MTRKELREDVFQDKMFELVDFVHRKQRLFITAGILLLVVVLGVGGGFWYKSAQEEAIAQAFYKVEQARQDASLEEEAHREALLTELYHFTQEYPDAALSASAWLEAGELEFQAKRADQAMAAFSKAQHHPGATSLQQALAVVGQGRLAEQKGEPAVAEGYFESLQDPYADLRDYNMARVLLEQGDREGARQRLQAVAALVPASPLASSARAQLDYLQ